MLKTLHQANLLGTLLKESNDISTKRASNHKKLQVMEQALDIVNQVNDFFV